MLYNSAGTFCTKIPFSSAFTRFSTLCEYIGNVSGIYRECIGTIRGTLEKE